MPIIVYVVLSIRYGIEPYSSAFDVNALMPNGAAIIDPMVQTHLPDSTDRTTTYTTLLGGNSSAW